jgi:hypothetical protein
MGISADIFTDKRADFRERLAAALAGTKTAYRVPTEGRSTAPLQMTDLDVAAALAYARQRPDDIAPDIAYCLITQSDWHRPRIVLALAEALYSYRLKGTRPYVLEIADHVFRAVVWGERTATPSGCPPRGYAHLLLAGAAVMNSLADDALRRAERAFRAAA